MSYFSSVSYFPQLGHLSGPPVFGDEFEELHPRSHTLDTGANGMPSDEAPPFSYKIHSYRIRDGYSSDFLDVHIDLRRLIEDEFFCAYDLSGPIFGHLIFEPWFALVCLEELVISYTDGTLAPSGPIGGFIVVSNIRVRVRQNCICKYGYHLDCIVRNYRMLLTVRDPCLKALPYYHVWESDRESECCVCYDTAFQTGYWCGHTVCHQCYVGIVRTRDMRCPYCRYQ